VHAAVRIGVLAGIVTLALASFSDAATQPSPCTLVSSKQVAKVTGLPVTKQILAPLGPTCIYKLANGSRQVTITVGSARFAALVSQIPRRRRRRVRVVGHLGYCGVLGQPVLYVSLPHGRVLTITAACGPAQKLAAIAVRRL
jgi:hypothetical protein